MDVRYLYKKNSKPQTNSIPETKHLKEAKPEINEDFKTELILLYVFNNYRGFPCKRENTNERRVLPAVMSFIMGSTPLKEHLRFILWSLFNNDDAFFEKHFSHIDCSLSTDCKSLWQFLNNLFIDLSDKIFQHGILWHKVVIFFYMV